MGGDRGDGDGVIEYTEMDKKEVHGLLGEVMVMAITHG